MALGLNYETADNENIVPIVKFDCRAGRMFKIDRESNGSSFENISKDVTATFKGVFDMENIEIGTISFAAGQAPNFCMVKLGQPAPPAPTADHKPGCRVLLKLSKELGGDIREMAATAKVFLRGFNALHDQYLAGVKDNIGKLPIVELKSTMPISSGEGAKKSTNYMPIFEIVGWTARPADLIWSPKNAPADFAVASTPPSTGSSLATAPAASNDDFG